MRRFSWVLGLVALGWLAGCPDEETADKVGGAPKRQLDQVQEKLDAATKLQTQRTEQAEDEAEEDEDDTR